MRIAYSRLFVRFGHHLTRFALPIAAILVAFANSGCSTQQGYATTQAWQRNECNKIADMQEQRRCIERADASYETYQRQSGEAKNPK